MTYLLAFGVPVVFSLVGWLCLNSLDGWLDEWRGKAKKP